MSVGSGAASAALGDAELAGAERADAAGLAGAASAALGDAELAGAERAGVDRLAGAASAGLAGAAEVGRAELAARQAELVAALVADGPLPSGFDPARVDAAATALLRKRAGEVGEAWPLLAAALGPRWKAQFVAWARGRVRTGSFADGFAFARELSAAGTLPALAQDELAEREALWAYDGVGAPVPRRWPSVRRTSHGAVLQVGGRLIGLRLPRH